MPAPHHSFLADRVLFLTPNQQCQSTEGDRDNGRSVYNNYLVDHVGDIKVSSSPKQQRVSDDRRQRGNMCSTLTIRHIRPCELDAL